jgi:hypothetical protein
MSVQDEQELDLQLGEAKLQISELRKQIYDLKRANEDLKMAMIRIQSITEMMNIHKEKGDEGERSSL